MFEGEEIAFVQAVDPVPGRGARRALLVGEIADPEVPDGPGLIVLSSDGAVESATPGVERWIAELPDGDWDTGRLPSAVLSVAARALRTAEQPAETGEIAVARVLARSGTWVVKLDDGDRHRARGFDEDRSAAPQERVRQDRRTQPAGSRREGLLLPLRIAAAGQRAPRGRRPAASRWTFRPLTPCVTCGDAERRVSPRVRVGRPRSRAGGTAGGAG